MKARRLREGQVFTMPGTAEKWRVERVTECSASVRPVAGGGRPVQISAHAEVEPAATAATAATERDLELLEGI